MIRAGCGNDDATSVVSDQAQCWKSTRHDTSQPTLIMKGSGIDLQIHVEAHAYIVNCSADRLASASESLLSGLSSSEKSLAPVTSPDVFVDSSPVRHPVSADPSKPCSSIRCCREARISSSSVLREGAGRADGCGTGLPLGDSATLMLSK